MTYFEKLHPWCIIRPLPNLQRRVVARCRRRSDAEAHLQILRRLIPNVTHTIVFDPTPEQDDRTNQSDRLILEENYRKQGREMGLVGTPNVSDASPLPNEFS
jgi:hypothetical protein